VFTHLEPPIVAGGTRANDNGDRIVQDDIKVLNWVETGGTSPSIFPNQSMLSLPLLLMIS